MVRKITPRYVMSAAVFAHCERRATAMPAEARYRQHFAAVDATFAPLGSHSERCLAARRSASASIFPEYAHDLAACHELRQRQVYGVRRYIEARVERFCLDAGGRDRRERARGEFFDHRSSIRV